MTGFESHVKRVADLVPGDRVSAFDAYFTVVSVEPAADGTNHLVVTFTNAPARRYVDYAEVVVLGIEKGEAPDESH